MSANYANLQLQSTAPGRPCTRELPASACSDSWESIFADHCKMIFWRTGWTRAIYNRKPPHLLTKLEEIARRGNRANARIKQVMDRADALRASNPNDKDHSPIGAVSASNPESNPAAPIG